MEDSHLIMSKVRLTFFQMQGAFVPTASRILENASRIFADSPVPRFSQAGYTINCKGE